MGKKSGTPCSTGTPKREGQDEKRWKVGRKREEKGGVKRERRREGEQGAERGEKREGSV